MMISGSPIGGTTFFSSHFVFRMLSSSGLSCVSPSYSKAKEEKNEPQRYRVKVRRTRKLIAFSSIITITRYTTSEAIDKRQAYTHRAYTQQSPLSLSEYH